MNNKSCHFTSKEKYLESKFANKTMKNYFPAPEKLDYKNTWKTKMYKNTLQNKLES